jgi:soluble lytic murein transglycosylase-like protein
MPFLMHGTSHLRCDYSPRGHACDATFQGYSMTTCFDGATQRGPVLAGQPAAQLGATGRPAPGLLTTTQHTLTIFGISAVALIGLLFARPDLASQLGNSLHSASITAAIAAVPDAVPGAKALPVNVAVVANPAPVVLSAKEKALIATEKQQEWVTTWLAKRYRVAGDAANMFVSTAYMTAHEIKLDPLLILAVMAIESGLNPFAESPVGAQGLMQVMSKIHHARFQELGGVKAALNPAANIRVGSLILKDYVTRGGSVRAGLKTYVGAAAFDNDSGYGSRVLAEYARLKQVSSGKKVPTNMRDVAATPPKKAIAQNEEIASL